MVSKASEDLPDPLSPVMTTSWSRGISRSMDLRLCSRAPRMTMRSFAMEMNHTPAEGRGKTTPRARLGAAPSGRRRPALAPAQRDQVERQRGREKIARGVDGRRDGE